MEVILLLLLGGTLGFCVGTLVEHERAQQPGHFE